MLTHIKFVFQMQEGLVYDFIIVGSGPYGLGCLSRLHETTEDIKNRLHGNPAGAQLPSGKEARKGLRIAVIDPSGKWLHGFKEHTTMLGMTFLRSPVSAHPESNDEFALLEFINNVMGPDHITQPAYAFRNRTEGFNDLFRCPSTEAFFSFCDMLSSRLDHDFFTGYVTDIVRKSDAQLNVHYKDTSARATIIKARNVVLAIGLGEPNVPDHETAQCKVVVHSSQLKDILLNGKNVKVLGGGASGSRSALKACRDGAAKVELQTRKKIWTGPYDVSAEWLIPETRGILMHEFYKELVEKRWTFIQRERRANIPRQDWKDLEDFQKQGILSIKDCVESSNDEDFDICVLSTGFQPTAPLLRTLCKRYKIDCLPCGLPKLHYSLRLRQNLNIFVVGSLSSLQTGPESSTMMGIRRQSEAIVNATSTVPHQNKYWALSENQQ